MIEASMICIADHNNVLMLVSVGIRKATSWYTQHLSLSRPPIRGQPSQILPSVVLLTDDFANRHKAEQEGLACLSGQ